MPSRTRLPFDAIQDAIQALADKPSPRAGWLERLREAPDLFGAASLEVWLGLAERAGVPHVPAVLAGRVRVEAMLRADVPEPEDAADFETLRRVLAALPAGHVARWDCCAGLDVKLAMSQPTGDGVPEAALRSLSPDDPRAFELIYEHPHEDMALWHRPWVRARYHDGYPVEYRVFVKNGVVEGVANYYIQRDLPDEPRTRREAGQAMDMAERMVAQARAERRYPWLYPYDANGWQADAVHATLDFLVAEDGDVLWLEGGPAFGAKAHPCAFLPRDGGAIHIAGIAFAQP